MGHCGCGDTCLDKAYKLPDGKILAYQIYQGCSKCFAGPGVAFYAYPDGKSPWLRLVKPEAFEPSEEGGNSGYGISIGLFEVEDLLAEAKHLEQQGRVGADEDDYATVQDWLGDFGLELIQGAMRRFQKRIAQQNKRHTGGAA